MSPAATRVLISRFLSAPEAGGPTAQSVDALPELTAREREVVAEVAGGLSNDEIAEKLCMSPLTVRSRVQHAIPRLDVLTALNSLYVPTGSAWSGVRASSLPEAAETKVTLMEMDNRWPCS